MCRSESAFITNPNIQAKDENTKKAKGENKISKLKNKIQISKQKMKNQISKRKDEKTITQANIQEKAKMETLKRDCLNLTLNQRLVMGKYHKIATIIKQNCQPT